jgi:hypothetical protein
MLLTRRALGKLAFAKLIDSKFHGVMIGSQSYSFSRPLVGRLHRSV